MLVPKVFIVIQKQNILPPAGAACVFQCNFFFLMRRGEDNAVSIFKGVLMLVHTFVLILLVVFQVIIKLKWILMLCWADASSRW